MLLILLVIGFQLEMIPRLQEDFTLNYCLYYRLRTLFPIKLINTYEEEYIKKVVY